MSKTTTTKERLRVLAGGLVDSGKSEIRKSEKRKDVSTPAAPKPLAELLDAQSRPFERLPMKVEETQFIVPKVELLSGPIFPPKAAAASPSPSPAAANPSAKTPAAIEPHAPHGDRHDFIKVTATLSPEVYRLVSDEMQRRKLAKKPNAQLSAILREAVVAYLGTRS
jgi:hypothetical protein